MLGTWNDIWKGWIFKRQEKSSCLSKKYAEIGKFSHIQVVLKSSMLDIMYLVFVFPKSWWRLLKQKRLALALHHNKFTYLDYSVFLLSSYYQIQIHIYLYIYIYIVIEICIFDLINEGIDKISFHAFYMASNMLDIQEQEVKQKTLHICKRCKNKIYMLHSQIYGCVK